jgi:hypothetical protein
MGGCGNCPGSGTGLGSTCGQNSTNDTTSNSTGDGVGELYLSAAGNNSISRFAGASDLNGELAPTSVISGATTQLDSPGKLLSDSSNDTLFVANAGNSSVLVFTGASNATGDAAPARVIYGTGTGLSSPTALALDGNHDVLYVANGNQSIAAFAAADTITGNVAPARVIAGSNTGFSAISGLTYDSANDVLYVVDSGASAVYAFTAPNAVTGNAFPARKLVGSATELSAPQDAVLVGTGMFVANGSGSILRFDTINTLNGAIAPGAVINGTATDLSDPLQLAYYSGLDGLFVDNSGGDDVLVFEGISSATGAPSPNLILTSTGISGSSGMAIDFSH